MFLLDGEINGAARLRQVARMLFDGSELQASRANPSNPVRPSPLNIHPPEILPRILPNTHSRTLFFAGKGGVAKTSVSCVTAVWLARQGYRTLLLTTDPAAHLGDVLGVAVGDTPAPVEGVPGLWAVKIDAKAAAEVYKARILDDARARASSPGDCGDVGGTRFSLHRGDGGVRPLH